MSTENSGFSRDDYHYMQQAIALAKQGHYTTSPNPRVGCLIVNKGEVVGRGYHAKAGQGHAEVYALKAAGEQANGATAYVTLEPCSHFGRTPPCAQALINAGVSKVIAAMVDPNPKVAGRGLAMLADAGIETHSGLLEAEAQQLNPGFIYLMRNKRPYLRCKLAASLDGKTAMASGESKWITSSAARIDVQRLRAQSCGVITGADSVLTDNAKMNVRWSELGELKARYSQHDLRQPLRVIIDGKHRLAPDLAIFASDGPILLCGSKVDLDERYQWPSFVEYLQLPLVDGYLDLAQLLLELGKRGLNDLLLESGARLAGAFFEQNLVNELILYQAPKLIGSEGKSLLAFDQIDKLADAKTLSITDCRMVGSDLRISAQVNSSHG
ncbi:bifunctional diaminohydroxyphosphoribosylaminopyrimidine deaminase/5-amino-6-(5-phosphoribosylamino)uracil reductase RibD [Endozoicomonas sp. G2_1]|uniref:bifunctional diaminohydroxyphosphoribosylaminopyrimidine deaminase/5-amino-6-(5-phosphoribosylamino)uracil reductase RibD n=1 Tax=Endozoicomonas sp. G2_1 TaxID=2821091 RepID=UPI001ADBC84B|nr:bifunctional diaminohydroxyphosphoribosylaminopyrimidine deaminase/5-amino-6-(5-phosphoribosylamino)uracil reductase RibD [Endozoicomonas sp. G2_1]MBO9489258.1 bifunctional diaminohydroxyphosphoribosylaminopyrimidine deaminase/5-amino-6-(5-phosphoribosylamino)uracil reductase RibD [Endozoicomonas sp. G2_1]